jgi:hypothetical protein
MKARSGKGHDTHKIRITTMSFRVTEEEKTALEARIKVCGLPKGEYFRQSLLHQQIRITAGRFHSDRLSLELRKMRETLEVTNDCEEIEQTINACNALLRQIKEIEEGDDAHDGTQDDQHE